MENNGAPIPDEGAFLINNLFATGAEVENEELTPTADAGGLTEQKAYYPKTHSEHIEWERLQMERKDNKAERRLRKEHATKTFWFTAVWASFLCVIILFRGLKWVDFDKAEFITIIGTLTTSMFAFYLLVMRFLFDKGRNNGFEKIK